MAFWNQRKSKQECFTISSLIGIVFGIIDIEVTIRKIRLSDLCNDRFVQTAFWNLWKNYITNGDANILNVGCGNYITYAVCNQLDVVCCVIIKFHNKCCLQPPSI